MPIHKFSLPRAALLLALGCAAFTTTARADEASLERAAQAQPEARQRRGGLQSRHLCRHRCATQPADAAAAGHSAPKAAPLDSRLTGRRYRV